LRRTTVAAWVNCSVSYSMLRGQQYRWPTFTCRNWEKSGGNIFNTSNH